MCSSDLVELVGWGAGEESWGIEHIVLHGNPAEPALWQQLDGLLINTRLPTEDGRALRIAACCIDSGGHHVQQVYEFATPRAARNVWAVKGQFGPRPVWPKRQTKSKKYRGHTVRLIGVDTAKDTIYARWQVATGKPGHSLNRRFPALAVRRQEEPEILSWNFCCQLAVVGASTDRSLR